MRRLVNVVKIAVLAALCGAPHLRAADSPLPPPSALPARSTVIKVEDPQATAAFEAQPDVVREMLDRGISALAGKDDPVAAWRAFVSSNDVVGIKVYSAPGPISGTRPALVSALVRGLLASGLPPGNIIIWDRQLADLRRAGFDELARRYGVRIAGALDSDWDPKAFYDKELLGDLVAGDYEFDLHGTKTGRKSYVTRLLTTNITKIITVAPLLNHNLAGVCGNLYSLAMGSVDNVLRFEAQPDRLAAAVPEIYAMPQLSDHVVLSITDALIGQYQGETTSLLHYSTAVNQVWLSKDPVALDTLAIQELNHERQGRNMVAFGNNPDLYHNAALLELGTDDPAKIRVDLLK